jgi:microcystin-dependent protein
MPTPIPIDFTMASAPLGWSGNLPALFTLIEASLSAALDPTFLIGSSAPGAPMPTHDLGPYFDGKEWWFWSALNGGYVPGQQGCAIGTIVMWGGGGPGLPGAPPDWLPCNGAAVSRFTYSNLFAAIGETWGNGDGQSTFNLPPPACFYINAAGWNADYRVPITNLPGLETTAQGVGSYGGSQTCGLLPSDMPALQVPVSWQIGKWQGPPQGSAGTNVACIDGSQSALNYSVDFMTDAKGNQTGPLWKPGGAQQFATVPPFATIYYIIKYQ